MAHRKIVAFAFLAIFAAPGYSQDTDARLVLDKVKAAYKALVTYQAQGTITLKVTSNGISLNTVTSFSILLKKPNEYRITWTQEGMPMPGMKSAGAVWNDGTKPYLYMGNGYSKMTSDDMALAGATGISGGAAFTVPSLFLPVFTDASPFVMLRNLKMEPAEKLENEECYVISAGSSVSKHEVFWISKSRYLILKYQHSLEAPEGGVKRPELTDEELDAAIKGMGQEVNPETRKAMRDMLERASRMLATSHLSGESTEEHAGIKSPALEQKDFVFTPPAGAVLKESLLDGSLK